MQLETPAKLAWMTDIHLNFLEREQRYQFYQEIVNTECNAILVSGDIAEATSVVDILCEMDKQLARPIYFVVGNHDYYRGQVEAVRLKLKEVTQQQDYLYWLPAAGLQRLTPNTILLGQDGWADGRLGNYFQSNLSLNDSRLIADLFQEKCLGKAQLLSKMQQLADVDATSLHDDLQLACRNSPQRIIVLTHVPPFKETCLYNGKISNDDGLPFFSSKAMGDVLLKVASQYTEIDFLVLCGHTHDKADYQALGNLHVKAGHAEYNQPEIQEDIII